MRSRWLNLNGLWDYAIVPRGEKSIKDFDGKILVPFPVESLLSGVARTLKPNQSLWYRRFFELPGSWQDERVMLHFGAVDWLTEVMLNGQIVGEHRGGFCPFSFELTALLRRGTNELVVKVWDPTGAGGEQRGKQSLKPGFIFYNAVSGIWQTVWLEPLPAACIKGIRLIPDLKNQSLLIIPELNNTGSDYKIEASAYDGENKIAVSSVKKGENLSLKINNPRLWSPDNPYLYDLKLKLTANGTVDQCDSYFGMREFSIGADSKGIKRLLLNGKPLFQHGPLDQGYWPDGLYTAPTEEALLYDLNLTKSYGFNMIRKHLKIEPARWYYHCDRIGLIVWQDMPGGGSGFKPLYNLILPTLFPEKKVPDKHYRLAGRSDPANREFFRLELKEMVDALYNFPCIGMWVIFNEGWGQFDAAHFFDWLKEYDSSRYLDHASGWFDQGVGQLNSRHIYMGKLKVSGDLKERAYIISEYGGYALPVNGHLWAENGRHFGQKKFSSRRLLNTALENLMADQLNRLKDEGLSGAVYTQLSDVENELSGLVTYDRKVIKVDTDILKSIKGGFTDD